MLRQLSLLLCLVAFGYEVSVGEEMFSPSWYEEMRQNIAAAKETRTRDSIENLERLIRYLGERTVLSAESEVLQKEAVDALISIPGSIDSIAKRIEEITVGEVENKPFPYHPSQRAWDIQLLGQLRSPETVKVLGEMLFDERDPWKGIVSDTGYLPNWMLATDSLFKLGLKERPVGGKYSRGELDLRTWQLWYQQVRAGTRTFSFEGDDRVYSLAGPVDQHRELEVNVSSSKTSASRQVEVAAQTEKAGTPATWAMVGAVVVLLVAVVATFRKSGRSASRS